MLLRKAILNAFYYSGIQSLLRPAYGGLGSILMLHHVRDMQCEEFSPNFHLTVSPSFLDEMLGRFKQTHDLISMDEMVKRLNGEAGVGSSRPFLAITLDDGYRDNFTTAAPIFEKHEVPYAIYIAPEMVDGNSTIWWEDLEHVIARADELNILLPKGPQKYETKSPAQKSQIYKELMEYLFLEVDEKQQRQIVSDIARKYGFDTKLHLQQEVADWDTIVSASSHPLCTIGAHTMRHFVLSKLDEQELRAEISQSREVLEQKLGTQVKHLAYPYGFPEAAGPREFRVAKELGFKSAVTTRHGVVYSQLADHMTALPRVSVNGHHQSMHYMETLLSGLPTRLKNYGKALDVA